MRKLYFSKQQRQAKQLSITKSIDGINNTIQYNDAVLNNVAFNINGDFNLILIHPGAILNNVEFHLYGDNHRVIIGPKCQFNERGSIWCEDKDCLISIGQGSTFEGVHFSATEPGSRLILGKDCMFSYDIDIRTGDSHSLIARSSGTRTNYAKDIIFGDHIWVASHCIFTKGARVASHSVVGTGSFINKQFDEEHVMIAGRPAQILKRDIQWLRERVYNQKVVSPFNEEKQKHHPRNLSHQAIEQKTG